MAQLVGRTREDSLVHARRAEHGPRRALVIDLFMHVGVMEKPS